MADAAADAAIECIICLHPLGARPCVGLSCAHCFHVDCIDAWLRVRRVCPTCLSPQPPPAPPPSQWEWVPPPQLPSPQQAPQWRPPPQVVAAFVQQADAAVAAYVQQVVPPPPAVDNRKRKRCPYCNQCGHTSAEKCPEMQTTLRDARRRARERLVGDGGGGGGGG